MNASKEKTRWTTMDEIEFIRSLSGEKFGKYINAISLRKRWGEIDEMAIKKFLKEGGEGSVKNEIR